MRTALELSLIENVAREDVDELTHTRLIPGLSFWAGPRPRSPAALGITEHQVRQRLALANLLPEIRDLFRAEELDAGRSATLTLATKTQQRDLLKLDGRPDAPRGRQLKGWLLCRYRHNSHYAERVIMPSRR